MSYKLRIILEYFQPKIGRRIRIFSLGRKNNILILKKKECNESTRITLYWRFAYTMSKNKLRTNKRPRYTRTGPRPDVPRYF